MADLSFDVNKEELFRVLVDLLVEFNRVCSENDIKYFVVGGTMLGAIRHNGFIPWDDDIDIAIPRKEYEKLKELAKKGVFRQPYFFQNPSTDEGYPKGFSRLRNSNTTQIPFRDISTNCNRGIFIDIIPLDVVPESISKREKMISRLFNYKMIMNSYSRYYSGIGAEGTTKKRAIAYYLILPLFKCRILTMKGLFNRFEKTVSQYKESNEECVGLIACTYGDKRFIWKRELWESKVVWHNFENIKVPIPERYDEILTNSYGDYMKPVKEPNNHGDSIYSIDVPYNKYVQEHFSELKELWLKEIASLPTKNDC
ncbi:MAG: LicD family protein [Lachnospiraceae bacterium]|nr:LicD family protein [Lachnospiraceae bacterium]